MLAINSDGSWWCLKHYTMLFIMLQHAILRPLNETRWLYKTGCNSRQCGIHTKVIEVLNGKLWTPMRLSLSRPTYPRLGTGGDLQELFDKFSIHGDSFTLQIHYIFCIGIPKIMKNFWQICSTPGAKLCWQIATIPTHCPTWGKWGLTMTGTLLLIISLRNLKLTKIIWEHLP